MRMPPSNIVTGQKIDGVKVARARELRRDMTAEELTLCEALRSGRLRGCRFRRQQVIDGFIVDFYCHAAGLIVEVDGPIHNQQVGYDAERDALLSARGFRILRVTNEEVRRDLNVVLARIGSLLDLTPPPPSPAGEGGDFPSSVPSR